MCEFFEIFYSKAALEIQLLVAFGLQQFAEAVSS